MSQHPPYDGLFPLDHYGLIQVSGEDAPTFLQGQLTCDAKGLANGASCLGALCTFQGRVLATFRLFRAAPDRFYLLLAADLAEAMRKRLQGYVLRSKVRLEDAGAERRLLGWFGDSAAPALTAASIQVPEPPSAILESPGGLALRLDEATGRSLVVVEPERLVSGLDSGAVESARIAWQRAGIEAGIPEITGAALSEEFLPQMLNLDALGGVSFQKGCYTGQEIVTRTHFLGQLKRRMFRLRGHSATEPAPASPVFSRAEAEPKSAGLVVAVAPEAPGVYQLLAVLGIEQAQAGGLRLLGPEGPELELLELPYTC
jgi:folate-binding protein YgfZ